MIRHDLDCQFNLIFKNYAIQYKKLKDRNKFSLRIQLQINYPTI